MIEVLVKLETSDRHSGRGQSRNFVVEDVSVGVGVEGVKILVRNLMMQPSKQVVRTIRVASQRTPQLIDLVCARGKMNNNTTPA